MLPDHSEETRNAMAEPLLSADQEKALARSIELSRILEALPEGTASEITLAILLQLCNAEPATRRAAARMRLDIPRPLYDIATNPQLDNAIRHTINDDICQSDDPDFEPVTRFSALSELVTTGVWEIVNELAPEADAKAVRKMLERPEHLLDALQRLIPRLAAFHRTVQREGARARETLVQRNTRLVGHIAHKYTHPGLDYEDRFQEGCGGLVTAIARFNHHRGYKFSTYATWWIRQAVTRAIADQARTIRLPVHIADKLNTLRRTRAELESAGLSPTTTQLAEAMAVTPKELQNLLRAEAQMTVSLDQPAQSQNASMEAGGATLADLIADPAVSTAEKATERVFSRQLQDAMDEAVTPREKQVLAMRYGFNGNLPMTLEQVGKEMGVSRERIRQVQNRALRKLRPVLAQKGMAQFAG